MYEAACVFSAQYTFHILFSSVASDVTDMFLAFVFELSVLSSQISVAVDDQLMVIMWVSAPLHST
jgi:hypothetical protein